MSWQARLKEHNASLIKEVQRLNNIIEEQNRKMRFLESLVTGPPTLMIACERIAESAASQCASAVRLVEEAKHIYGRR